MQLDAKRQAQVVGRLQILVGECTDHVEVARADFVEQRDGLGGIASARVDVVGHLKLRLVLLDGGQHAFGGEAHGGNVEGVAVDEA